MTSAIMISFDNPSAECVNWFMTIGCDADYTCDDDTVDEVVLK